MAVPSRIPAEHQVVFPAGAYAVEVVAVQDYDEQTRKITGQASDPDSGLPVWQVVVHDPDPGARSHEAKVKIVARAEPEMPAAVDGHPLRPVIFDGLTITAYLDSNARRSRVAYSLRATGMRAPTAPTPAAPSSSGGRGRGERPDRGGA